MSFVRVVDSIEGAVNLRDFGGYRTDDGRLVRTGLLYRSGNTHEISAEGLAHLAQQLGIHTVVDLRSPVERSYALSEFEAHGIRNVHEPLETGVGANPLVPLEAVARSMALGRFDWGEMYWNLLHMNAERFARILVLLTQPDTLPVLVHCAGGRDRTGVTAAVVQLALGVRHGDIAEDFALSSQLLALGAPRPEFDRLFGSITDIPREDIVRAMATRADTMDAFLMRAYAAHGSAAGILRMLGVPESVREKLREVLLQPAGRPAQGAGTAVLFSGTI